MGNKNILFFLMLPILLLGGCKKESDPANEVLNLEYEAIVEDVQGTTVTFYMWGGSAVINKWIDTFVADALKEKYGITLKRVPADAGVFINKLLAEKQAGKKAGTIDLIWINGENFKKAMDNELLFGPFAEKLPNYNRYIDQSTVEFDFGYPVKGYEAPYGRAQFVFEYDSDKIKDPPDSFEKLLDWVKANPGRFTYPQPPDFTGSAFVRQAFYATTGGYAQYLTGYDQTLFNEKSSSLWTYLNEIKPNLWQDGKTYPKDQAALESLFERGEIDFSMSYTQSNAQNKILQGRYKKSVRTFVMESNSIYNTHFTAIPFNSPNKKGAIVTANFLLSPEAQLSKNNPENWGDFTVLDVSLLSEGDRKKFEKLDLGEATLPFNILAQNGVPEIPAAFLEKLEEGWEKNVLR